MSIRNADGLGHPPARRMLDGRHRRSCTGTVPTPKGDGLVPFESLLEGDLIMAAADRDVVALRAQPETFRWLDDVSGRWRRYTPDLLVTLRDGTRTYREVKPHAVLVRDPLLKGRRPRIEAECFARRARFEVWTEREIRPTAPRSYCSRPATLEEARNHAEALADAFASGSMQLAAAPDHIRELASLIPMRDMRRVGGLWIGYSGLTGILTVLDGDRALRPGTRAHFREARPGVRCP